MRRITEIELPRILYKYRDWTNLTHQKIIIRHEVYFARPSEFNGPFDGNIPIRGDLITYDECLEKNLEILNIVHHDEYSGLYCTTQSGVKCTIESGAKCTTF
jgi:hypothetical protein